MSTFFTMLVPIIIGAVALWGMVRKVDVYSALIAGAEEGLGVLIRIVPALVGLLTAVYMLRASGALELAAQALAPLLNAVGIPPETVALMLVRPVISTADYHTVLGYLMIYLDDEYMVELWQDITWGKTANVFLVRDTGELLMKNSMMNDYSEIFSQADPKQGNYIFRYEKEPYVLDRKSVV